ncbi:hypothetical protein [Tenacibaculum finnmarkense]|uniref:hypothetical protein n=1 Tax=Tenacibaculum finnmarkense TaxID=2781243 RepID=UPI001E4DEFE8|nr:hypothetical protein [Tenacibaculum finnmarkense]MCD8445639.1 hypothetical protein [Tenacibaculum finnmarkense genomovar ulcerans]MCG8860052.1 hypothetical protein [Tenacibaculum finnmarkense]
MKKHSLRFLTLTLIGTMLFSCQKEDEIIEQTPKSQYPMEGMMKLGEQLENPYSVENMRKALDNLKKSNVSAKTSEGEIEITTTHLYIKFKPKNEEELSILKRDSTLVLYTYPLDYEIEGNGDFYIDPEIPEGQPTYQYCAIKIDKKLPNGVENEILEELFIPDEDKDVENGASKKSISSGMIDTLVDEALLITGNLEEEENNLASKSWRRSKWRPSGKITMNDDNLGNIGIEGLKIRARRWFTTHRGFTNTRGEFSCDGRFRGKARYRLDWERHHFALRSGGFSSAEKRGPRGRKKSWNWHITSGKHKYYATIFRAAYHYYYKDIKGLRRPKLNSLWHSQLRIGAFTQDNGDTGGVHQNTNHFGGLVTGIKIYQYDKDSDDVYATTIHELTHSSHFEMNGSNVYEFNKTDIKVKESWARGVQWVLTRMVYPNYEGGSTSSNYTQVVVDMIDSNYSSLAKNLNNGLWNDNVTGYTIRQIEDALEEQENWGDWRDNINKKYKNETENHLDALFAYWD